MVFWKITSCTNILNEPDASKKSIAIHKITWYHIPEDCMLILTTISTSNKTNMKFTGNNKFALLNTVYITY
jgi:hypothetical protein